jgi:hypothetical protein
MLLETMGWEDYHLHSFVVGNSAYGNPDPDFGGDTFDEKRHTLTDIAPNTKDRFRFDYDFGDGWEHNILVEKIGEPETGVKYPRCTDGANACPPEDCGGPYGYKELRETLADPAHESMREWAGGKFDPAFFDVSQVNRRLKTFTTKNTLRSDTTQQATPVGT